MLLEWPTIDDVNAAAGRIDGAIMRTPCLPSETLSRIAGCGIHLKFENLQFTASFKERGALNKLLCLISYARPAGVCAMSAGNHAQGLAYHAQRLGIPATIVMPRGTPMTKIIRTREHGATVIIEGESLEAALAVAEQRAQTLGLVMVHPYDDPEIVAGQGTLGLEIVRQIDELDTIVVPIGGGGLVAGVAIAAKAYNPRIRIIGVQTRTYPSMVRAIAGEKPVRADGMTIAEGIAVKSAGVLTREIVRALVDDVVLVEEASIERAVALLQSVEKTVVEGAGAAGLAAILEQPELFAGRRVAVPLTGGNIDGRMFASVIMRDLVRSEQLVRFRVAISDQPGALARLATVVGEEEGNIVDVAHDRLSLSLNPKGAALDLVIELQGAEHREKVLAALREQHFNPTVQPIG